jgi:hypothetical protein
MESLALPPDSRIIGNRGQREYDDGFCAQDDNLDRKNDFIQARPEDG